ncbi:MAG: hypothetical protein SNH57_00740 [Rikenellaceae bacterium]
MKRANYDSKPSVIEAVGNGSYLYRWDIEEVTTEATEATDEQEAQEAHTSWECYEVTVWNTPTENSITEVVVDALWGNGVEQKLLNDYYSAIEGILNEESYKQPYLDFLAERKAIKEQITADFADWSNN